MSRPRATTEGGPRPADVEAAVDRWAAAAGVPEDVVRGTPRRPSAARRFLRGVLLGGAVALPMVLLATVDGPADGIRATVVLAVLVVGLRIALRRRGTGAAR